MIGRTDQANHQYDLTDFNAALAAGNLPAVTFLKAKKYQDGHPGYSDPLDEQAFLVSTINAIQQSPFWSSTAILINYDDSDGWYDHAMGPLVSQSNTSQDALTGAGKCGTAATGAIEGRCGYGPRLPLLAISPYARINFVDHAVSDQSSILRFIEDNWSLGRIGGQSFDALAGSLTSMFDFSAPHAPVLVLDPASGEPAVTAPSAVPAAPLAAIQSGALAGNSGGTFAYYQLVSTSATAPTLTLSVSGSSAANAHQIGINAYQGGTRLGNTTLRSTGLGDSSTSTSATLTLHPSSSGGMVTIQVFNYSASSVTFTLTWA
jgi:phospholipase C